MSGKVEGKEYQLGGYTGKGWLPGQSGNPAGRPPNIRYLSEIVRELLKEVGKSEYKDKTNDELVSLALLKEALAGNTKAIEMLHDWTEGKVAETHLNVNVATTPEGLRAAQERLSLAQGETEKLLVEFPKR